MLSVKKKYRKRNIEKWLYIINKMNNKPNKRRKKTVPNVTDYSGKKTKHKMKYKKETNEESSKRARKKRCTFIALCSLLFDNKSKNETISVRDKYTLLD